MNRFNEEIHDTAELIRDMTTRGCTDEELRGVVEYSQKLMNLKLAHEKYQINKMIEKYQINVM